MIARLLVLVVLLLAGSADSFGFGRGGGLTCPKGYAGGGLVPCSKRAYFEFAPADGVGMDGLCSCSTITGAKGEAMSFTRASRGSCVKSPTTAVANGDMVICPNGTPRVMPDPDGVPALLIEPARTNAVPRSQEVDDASYGDFTAGAAAAPVLNGADAALAPDGTLTAEDYTFDATAAPQASARALAILTATTYSSQLWVRGQAGSGAIDLCLQTAAAPTATCSSCSFVATAWTQCRAETILSIAGGQIYLGNMTLLNGGTVRPVNRVYVWGLDAQIGKHETSYIPTAGAPVARSAEAVSITLSAAMPKIGSLATSYTPNHGGAATLNGGAEPGGPWMFSGSFRPLYADGLTNAAIFDNVHGAFVAAAWVRGTKKSYCTSWSEARGQRVRNISDSTISTSAFTAATYGGTASLSLSGGVGSYPSGLISSICMDSNENRCCP